MTEPAEPARGTADTGTPHTAAAERASAFVHAVLWGEHTTLWDLLSDTGRSVALTVAVRNGMDAVTAARIRDGLTRADETERFLRELLGGLRRDFRNVDLSRTTAAPRTQDVPGAESATVAVELCTPSAIPGTGAWPAGRVILSRHPERGWLVDRLEPRLTGP